MIDVIDPFQSFYDIYGVNEVKVFKKQDVEAADYLVKIARKRKHDYVGTFEDWGVLAKVFEFYTRRWPADWAEFSKTIVDIRGTRARKDGFSREKGREGTRYLAAVPLRLMKIIKIVFPEQQWDREFTNKFIENIKIARVGEKVDTWFTFPSFEKKLSTDDIIKKEISKIKNGNTRQNTKRSRT